MTTDALIFLALEVLKRAAIGFYRSDLQLIRLRSNHKRTHEALFGVIEVFMEACVRVQGISCAKTFCALRI